MVLYLNTCVLCVFVRVVGGQAFYARFCVINVLTRQCAGVIPLVLSSKPHRAQVMKLPLCLTVLVVTVGVVHSAPEDPPSNIPEDTLKREPAEAPRGTRPEWNRSARLQGKYVIFITPPTSPPAPMPPFHQSCRWVARNLWMTRWGGLCMGWSKWGRWCGGTRRSISISWRPSCTAARRRR